MVVECFAGGTVACRTR